jgi:hypothetical protein
LAQITNEMIRIPGINRLDFFDLKIKKRFKETGD